MGICLFFRNKNEDIRYSDGRDIAKYTEEQYNNYGWISNILSHAKTSELRAAALSAPYVAKYGKLISGQKNHENTGLTTLTFASPVIINGQKVNVGVVIQFVNNGKPRAVNVALQSGEKFVIDTKKVPAGLDSRVERYVQGTTLPTTDTNSSIYQTTEKSQEKFSEDTKKASEAEVEGNGDGRVYSERVQDPKELKYLNDQEKKGNVIRTYKAMQIIDGKLYSPMAAKVKGDDGKYHLAPPSEIGVWQKAVEDTTNIKIKNGRGYYTLNKGNGKSIDAAYNPYEHSSNMVLNDQFEEAYQRPNLVTVECIIPRSELTNGYRANYAKDSVGMLDWKAGIVAGKLKNNSRKVYLSRWLKPVRILSDAEVASMYKDILAEDNISVPFNVVTPSLLSELENQGVPIDYDGSPLYRSRSRNEDIRYDERSVYKKKKLSYNEFNTLSMQWANSDKTSDGDLKILYDGRRRKYYLIEATKEDMGFVEIMSGKYEELERMAGIYDKRRGEYDNWTKITRIGQANNSWDSEYAGFADENEANGEFSNRELGSQSDRAGDSSQIGRDREVNLFSTRNEAVEKNLAKRSRKYNALADKRDNMERFTLDEFNSFYKRGYRIRRIINIRYADKKRIQEWLNVNRVQSPLRSSIMDSINSILQTTEKSQEEFSKDTKKASEAEVEGNRDGRV